MTIFLAIFASLFSVVNPLGAIPVYLALTPDYSRIERRKAYLSTSLYFVIILLSFYLAGSFILGFFGVSVESIKIAGGLVILSSGVALLKGDFAKSRAINQEVRDEAVEKEDISFAPMAMPMLSGPGSISLLLGYASEYSDTGDKLIISASILAVGIIVLIILAGAPLLFRVLGVAGLKAISRIMGFIVMAIGVQYILSGIIQFTLNLT